MKWNQLKIKLWNFNKNGELVGNQSDLEGKLIRKLDGWKNFVLIFIYPIFHHHHSPQFHPTLF